MILNLIEKEGYRSHLLIRIAALLIAGEMVLTGLGFCGHTHAHLNDHDEICFSHQSANLEAAHEQRPVDPDRQGLSSGQSKCDKHFHCPCLGSFLGIIESVAYRIELICDVYIPLQQVTYHFIWCPTIYHPPLI